MVICIIYSVVSNSGPIIPITNMVDFNRLTESPNTALKSYKHLNRIPTDMTYHCKNICQVSKVDATVLYMEFEIGV